MNYVIEPGVPMVRACEVKKSPLRRALDAMAVGDSIALQEYREVRYIACNKRYFTPRDFAVRKTQGGWRVWRTA
jgi:hypothetical protein